MSLTRGRILFALVFCICAVPCWAQTADEVIERALTAVGGRAALAKLKSRATSGSFTISTPAGDAAGTIEILNAVPNKIRTLVQLDLSSLGAGAFVQDTRFDGTSGYVLDSLQGDHAITGNQLDNLRNSAFPHSFLNFKESGTTVALGGREKVAGRDAYVLIFEPTAGSVVRQFIDAETYQLLQSVVKVDVPQIGQQVELTTAFSDYRDVDGVKLPFRLETSSSIQNYTIQAKTVEHNVSVDERLFVKPPQ